jgi:hypothetical protein
MEAKEYAKLQKDMIMQMKMMDVTIKGVKESEEYKAAQEFNAGVRSCLNVLKRYKED